MAAYDQAMFAATAFLTPEVDRLLPLAPPEMWGYLHGDPEELRREYARLFLDPAGAACPPRQSAHITPPGPMGWPHHSALSWYRFAGVELHRDNEPADHIGLLLTWWAHLTRTEESPNVLEAFHAEHLSWVPAFCGKLAAEARHPFYRLLARLAADCVRMRPRSGASRSEPEPRPQVPR
jgi:TorA maturation chaperone TorD